MNNTFFLIYEFFKTGLFAIGGGLAAIPFLQEMSKQYKWFSSEELYTMIAISESTPGSLGVNMSTYTGFLSDGLLGGILATISLILPGMIIIGLLSKSLHKFQDAKMLQYAFDGVKPAITGFILAAVMPLFLLTLFKVNTHKLSLSIFTSLSPDYVNILFFLGITLIYAKFKLHPILIVAGCGFMGYIFKL